MLPLVLAAGLMQSSLHTPGVVALATPLEPTTVHANTVAQVPFYSQFKDISSSKWQKVGCGIASLAMVIDYYEPDSFTSVDKLLSQGVKAGAYSDAGWSHEGLVALSKKYGLTGSVYDLSDSSSKSALAALETSLGNGPVIASVHYKFQPTNPIPHLVVITGIKDGKVYYNDPAAKSGQGSITLETFLGSWKKRYIAIRPAGAKLALASV